MITVISGKLGSEKSDFALKYASQKEGKKYYIATMRVISEEDKKKVEKNRLKREGLDFVTIEQDVAIVKAIDKIKWMESLLGAENRRVALIENLPTLVRNEMFLSNGEIVPYKDVNNTILFGIAFLKEFFDDIIIVTEDTDGYNDDIGEEFLSAMMDLNKAVSGYADECYNY